MNNEEKANDCREIAYQYLLQWREIEKPCPRCHGIGIRAYPDTSTWHGGIGGQMITSDVCDECWGTGDADRKGCNLRAMQQEIERLRRLLAQK